MISARDLRPTEPKATGGAIDIDQAMKIVESAARSIGVEVPA